MKGQYYDPWAKVGDSAVNAYGSYLKSRPDASAQADVAAKNALAEKYRMETQMGQNRMEAPNRMGDIISQIMSPVADRPAPDFQGPMGKIDVTPEVMSTRYQQNMPDIMANAMNFAGDKPGALGDVLMAISGSGGASPEQITGAQRGSGMDYVKTKEGFEADPSNNGYTLSPGSVRFGVDNQRVASADFKPSSGAQFRVNPDGSVEYNEDGLGNGVELTKSTANALQGEQLANAKLRGMINFTRDLAKKDPMNFGFPGFVKGVAQDTRALVDGVSQTLGYQSSEESLAEVQREAVKAGISSELLTGIYDPNLSALQTASDLLVFHAASALASQSGRSLSDNDVKNFKRIVGDPKSFMANQQRFLSKLNVIENILGMGENVADTAMGGNVAGAAKGRKELPTVGEVKDGYRYKGGKPSDPSNWEQL